MKFGFFIGLFGAQKNIQGSKPRRVDNEKKVKKLCGVISFGAEGPNYPLEVMASSGELAT